MSIPRASLPYHSYAIEGIEDNDTPLALTAADVQQGGRVVMGNISGAPTLVSATPADDSGAVAVGANIVLTFSSTVMAGSGTIRIGDGYAQTYIDKSGHLLTRWVGSTDSRLVNLNNPSDADQVTISGNTVTINLANDLKAGVTYSVTMASGVLKDLSNRPYSGLTDSNKLNFTTDSTAQISGAIHFEDTGVSQTDYITNSAAQTVHGTYSGILGASEHVQVSIDNGATWHIASAANGSWSYSSVDPVTASSTMLARVLDSNEAPRNTVSQAFVYDHTAPTIVGKPVISDTNLTAGESATVTVTFSEQVANFSVSSTVVGSTYSDFTSDDGGLTWTANVTGNAVTQNNNANDIFHVSATDLAGNALVSTEMADYFHISHAINTTIGLSDDTGDSNSDFYTATAAQTLSGSYLTLPTSGHVKVSLDGGSTFTNATVDSTHHTWSLDGTLLNGTNSIVVHVVDGENLTTESYSHSYTLDTQAATQSMADESLDLDSADDSSGASNTDNITNVVQPHVTVSLNNMLHLHVGDEIQIVDTNHDNAIVGTYVLMESDLTLYNGGPEYTANDHSKDILLNQSLSEGVHNLQAQIGDLAGNAAATASGTLAVTVDTHAPTLTGASALHLNDTSIVLTFNEPVHVSNDLSFTLSGGAGSQSLGVGNSLVTYDGNTVTLTVAGILSATNYSLELAGGSITDLAGNAIAFSGDHVSSFSTPASMAAHVVPSATAEFSGGGNVFGGQFYSETGLDRVQLLDGSNWINAQQTVSLGGNLYSWAAALSAPASVIEVRLSNDGLPQDYLNYGNSVLYFGSTADDTITNNASHAIVFSGAGNDHVTVGDDAHVVTGSGSNHVVAGTGANVSSNGFDLVVAGNNATVQLNGSGSTVNAGTGLTLTTSNGAHSIILGSVDATSIAAGSGNDTLNFSFNNQTFALSTLSGSSHMSGIDIVNMLGTGNTITVGALTDVTALSGTSRLVIAGDASTTVQINGSVWTDTHTTSSGYEVYHGIANSDIQLLVLVGMPANTQ